VSSEAATQIVTLDIAELERSGVTNAEQVVKFISQQQGGTVTSASVSGTNGGASYADLRSLGANRTLVLLNGKRVAPNPFAVVGTDLNTLPLAAVARIETLADGASAIYGTDAIAGVINFITKREYKGVSVGVGTQNTEDGGGDVKTATVLAGFGDLSKQGWNVFAGLNLRMQNPMGGTQRAFSATSYIPSLGFNGLSPTAFPANYSQTGTVANANPTSPACDPPGAISAPETNGTRIRCFADTQIFTNTVPEQDQNSLLIKGTLQLSKDHTATLEYFRSFNKVGQRIAPSPEGGLTMPQTSPYFPGNGAYAAPAALDRTRPISIAWRTVPMGSREGEQENVTQRLVASVDGNVAGWDYSLSTLASRASVQNYFLNGYPATLPLRAGVSGCASGFNATTGACTTPLLDASGNRIWLNPFGQQTPAGNAYLNSIEILGQIQDGQSNTQAVTATVSRPVMRLGGGDAMLAVSLDFRKEDMVYRTDITKASQAASSGLAGAGALREGDRDIKAASLELSLPFVKGFEVGLSLRHDEYSDFGGSTNPKLTLRWQPSNNLLVRASANTGFAAPSLYNLYLPNQRTFTANRYNDPVLCPGGVPNLAGGAVPSRDCGIQFQQLQGGNATLKPEESQAWTVGLVFQPMPSLTLGVDYWKYSIKDSISTIGEQSIFADPAKYAALYRRCSQVSANDQNLIGACQTPGGDPLAYVINTFLNLGDAETSGIDWQANWNSGATPMGRFNVSARGTYVTKYEFQIEPGGRWFNPVGRYTAQFAGGAPVIRYQQVTTVAWDKGDWSVLLSNRHVNGYWDQNAQGAPFNVAPFNNRKVGKYSVSDVSVSYSGLVKGLTLQAGILNVLDKDPPFTNQVGRFQARGYDDRFHNPLGRTYQLSAKYEF
ncbi:MAG: TonB-dependent receptor, partial [Rubrivivax sp.]|nr:TonB-dependent receptor [Rubrivivax sp.]